MTRAQTQIAFFGPLALGFAAYAAILLIGSGGELLWTRFAIGAMVLLSVAIGGAWALRKYFEKRGR